MAEKLQFLPETFVDCISCYNAAMTKKSHNPNPNGKNGNPISLAPLSPDQALAGLLRVKPADVKGLEAAEKKAAKKSAK